jgi:hypothetical protein
MMGNSGNKAATERQHVSALFPLYSMHEILRAKPLGMVSFPKSLHPLSTIQFQASVHLAAVTGSGSLIIQEIQSLHVH